MITRILMLCLLCSPLMLGAQTDGSGARQLTLQECLRRALTQNYGRQSMALNESAQEDIYRQSKTERLPSLSASVGESVSATKSHSSSWNGTYSVNANMTLYQGGTLQQSIEQNKLSAEVAGFRSDQYDNELIIQVLQAFLNVLSYEELLNYQEAVVAASKEQMVRGEVRLKAGEILKSDYLLLEAQYANDRNNILEATINRDNSLIALKNLLAMDLGEPIGIVYPEGEEVLTGALPAEEEVLQRFLAYWPDLRISDYTVAIAEKNVALAKAAYAPTISLTASGGTGHSENVKKFGTQLSDRLNAQAGISVSIPIFNRNRTKSNVTQSRISLQQAEFDRMQKELDSEQSLLQEYRNVVSAGSKYRTSTVRLNAYDASYQSYRNKFAEGAITTVELLQQQNDYISAMNDYIQNKYSYLLRRRVLDVYMGEPLEL